MAATVDAVLTKGNRVVFTLRKIKVPDVSPRSYEFPTHVLSFATADPDDISLPGAKLDPSPTVGIDQAADGTGTISITKGDAALTNAKAGESLGDIGFTYIAGGIMEVGSEVEIEIPDRWPAPIVDDGDTVSAAGEVSLVGVVADLGVSESDRTVTATLQIRLRRWRHVWHHLQGDYRSDYRRNLHFQYEGKIFRSRHPYGACQPPNRQRERSGGGYHSLDDGNGPLD